MKQDKYLGYWLIKGSKNFIKVIGGVKWGIEKDIAI